MPKKLAWKVLQAWPWKYATTLAHRAEVSSDPSSLTPGRTFPQQPALFHVCLLGERELGVGAWEGGTPGFPQASG